MKQFSRAMVVVALSAVAMPTAANAVRPVARAAEPDALAVQSVIAALRGVMRAQAASATSQDIEAALVFALDQQQQPAPVSLTALNYLLGNPDYAHKVRAALVNVRLSVRRGQRGTASIADGGDPTLIAGPIVTGGNAGATYSAPN